MSFEVDVYDTLKRNGLMLAPHIVKILKELGYNDIHTLVQIESPELLEKTIKNVFGECEIYKALSEEEKKGLLGPRCQQQPSYFKFLPGEEASLKSIKTFCSAILEKMPLIYLSSNTCEPNPSFSLKTSKQIGRSTGFNFSHNSSHKNKEAVDITGKSMLPSDDEIAIEIKKCIPIALKKMNDLGVELTGKDLVNFSFSSKYGNQIRSNTICQDDLKDDDEEDEQDGQPDADECDETEAEQDPYDLEVLRSLQDADLRDFSNNFKDPCPSSFSFVKLADAEGNM